MNTPVSLSRVLAGCLSVALVLSILSVEPKHAAAQSLQVVNVAIPAKSFLW